MPFCPQLKRFQAAKNAKTQADAASSLSAAAPSVPTPPPSARVPPPPRASVISPPPPPRASVVSPPPPPRATATHVPARVFSPPVASRPATPSSPPHSASTGVVISPPILSPSFEDAQLVSTQRQTIQLLVSDKERYAKRIKELETQLSSQSGPGDELRDLRQREEASESELAAARDETQRLEDEARTNVSNLAKLVSHPALRLS